MPLIVVLTVTYVLISIPDANAKAKLKTLFSNIFNNIIKKDKTNLKNLIDNKVKQSKAACENERYLETYCKIVRIKLLLFDNIQGLISVVESHDWNTEDAKHRKTAILSYLIVNEVTASTKDVVITSKEILDILYKLIKDNDVHKLRKFAKFMPLKKADLVKGKFCNPLQTDFNTEIHCTLTRVFEEIYNYLRMIRKRESINSKVIDTTFDYKILLEQMQIERVGTTCERGRLEIQADLRKFTDQIKEFIYNVTDSRFGELEKYFSKLASFGRRKATFDANFLRNKLKQFDDDIREVSSNLERRMKGLVLGSVRANTLDLAQKQYLAIMKIAAACNPFKPDPGAIIETANDIAQSVVNLMRSQALETQFGKLVKTGTNVALKLSHNDKDIKIVRSLIDGISSNVKGSDFDKKVDKFLKLYDGFDPRITKQELKEFGSSWEAAIDEACGLIYAGETLASSVLQGIFASQGDCLKTKALSGKLLVAYGEIYDYQLSLMGTLAEVVRAHVAEKYAKNLSTKFKELRKQENSANTGTSQVALQQLSLTLMLLSRLHTLQVVSQYCDVLEYKNAGVRPQACNFALDKLDAISVSNLIAYHPPQCYSTFDFVDIPTKPKDSKDQGYIDLKNLYAGKKVSFKIPNMEWLKKYGWIIESDENNAAFYVNDFELYLPDEIMANETRMVKLKISAADFADLSSKTQFTYNLEPDSSFVFEYKENLFSCRRRNSHIFNPYRHCRDDNRQICIITDKENRKPKLPSSVFSKWNIELKYPKHLTMPKFTTHLYLKAAVGICKIVPHKRRIYRRSVASASVSTSMWQYNDIRCCNRNKANRYWDQDTSACKDCPAGSKVSNYGYYCQRK